MTDIHLSKQTELIIMRMIFMRKAHSSLQRLRTSPRLNSIGTSISMCLACWSPRSGQVSDAVGVLPERCLRGKQDPQSSAVRFRFPRAGGWRFGWRLHAPHHSRGAAGSRSGAQDGNVSFPHNISQAPNRSAAACLSAGGRSSQFFKLGVQVSGDRAGALIPELCEERRG